jgi:D-alanyl-D-alanine carboxypeptidase (penicillin-binding protein 5/6)
LRRSEAILLFLAIAAALVFFTTRPSSSGGLPGPLEAAATVAAGPGATNTVSAARTAVITSSTALAGPTAAPTPAPTAGPEFFAYSWLQQHPAGDIPAVTAEGVMVVDRDTQQIMYTKGTDVRRPPASIMKIVTAMVALDLARPTQTISVSRDAANMEPNRMGLSYGEQLTVQDVLYGLLLDSGNDAAEALADSLPGGRAAFLKRMNDKAASLGLKNSHFVDPAGLDDENSTTPYDMAVLADAALTGYPTIRNVVSTKEASINATATHKPFRPINLNQLLWDYPGTYGVKVGYTDAADYTIVLGAQKNNHNVLVVLLGSDHHFTEGKKLLDWAFAHPTTPDGTPVRKFDPKMEPGSVMP